MRETALLFLELGGIILLLGVLGRLALRTGISPIPFYLLGGLAFGEGGLIPVVPSERFIEVGAEIGVILLLLTLGLEYTGRELVTSLRSTTGAGLFDLAANSLPGFALGLLFGLGPLEAVFLGGITYISSSGVTAKLVSDLGWIGNRETPIVLSILVFEDLAMAVLLPILGALALGGTPLEAFGAVAGALAAVAVILYGSYRQGSRLGRIVFSGSDEVNLLTLLGITLVVAGVAEQVNASAAVGAFLVGIGLSGEAANRARALLAPLRDLFAAVFFVFFGLRTDPAELPAVVVPVLLLAAAGVIGKLATGWWAASRVGIGRRGRLRSGTALVARGEFSIVIAGLALTAGAGPRLAAIAAGYVLVMAALGPLAARLADRPAPA